MDTTKTTTHIGLCAGYGGIELGLKRVIPNLRSVALCEIEAFACANLVAKMEAGLMEPAPIWTDLKTFPWESFRDRVDILTGGYPCQPFSAAGKRLGTEDPRHLWPFIAGGIHILRPKLCFFENVEGHISLGLREVIGELESMGYKVSLGIFSAREVGAPHQRKRVFILAYDKSLGIQGCGAGWLQESRPHAGQGLSVCGGNAGCSELADSSSQRDRKSKQGISFSNQCVSGREEGSTDAGRCLQAWPSRPGEPQHAWEPPRVVVDAKSQRAGQRSELRGEECGSGSALSRDIEQSGEATLANNHRPHAGHGEQRPERTFGDLSGGCGEGSGNVANSNRNEPSEGRGDNAEVSEVSSKQWKDKCSIISGGESELSGEIMANSVIVGRRGRNHGDAGGLRGEIQVEGSCGSGAEEVLGNASSERPGTLGTEPAGQQRQASIASTGDAMGNALLTGSSPERPNRGQQDGLGQPSGGTMGNADSPRPQERTGQRGAGIQGTHSDGGADAEWQAQPPLGGDADGPAGGLDYAELCVSCDNRTDELRLLGNGVVPATAERAFRTLLEELNS